MRVPFGQSHTGLTPLSQLADTGKIEDSILLPIRACEPLSICNSCHPFYTGRLKFIDTAGRIEKFQTKFAAGSYASLQKPAKKKAAKPQS